MPIDDAAYGRQADAAAFEFVRPVKPLKRAEQLLRVIHFESHTVAVLRSRSFSNPAGRNIRQ